jgi:hypothetical protein
MQSWSSLSTDQKIALLSAMATSLSFLAALAVVLFAWRQLILQRKANQLQLFETVFLQIRDCERSFIKEYLTPYNILLEELDTSPETMPENLFKEKTPNPQEHDAPRKPQFLQHHRVPCLPATSKVHQGKASRGLYTDAFVFWYDELFTPHASTEALNNPKQYREFKALVMSITNKRRS